jgi:hypothetical protein
MGFSATSSGLRTSGLGNSGLGTSGLEMASPEAEAFSHWRMKGSIEMTRYVKYIVKHIVKLIVIYIDYLAYSIKNRLKTNFFSPDLRNLSASI